MQPVQLSIPLHALKSLLSQCLVEHDGYGIGQIQGTDLGKHRDTDTGLFMLYQDLFRDSGALLAKHDIVVRSKAYVAVNLMRLCRLYRISLDELCGYSANSADAMRLSDSGQRVKVYARRKERRYLADSVLDLSTDEQQLLAYYRSASPEDRAELFEHLRNARYRDRRHANAK